MLSAERGDPVSGEGSTIINPRPDWSRGVMDQVREGKMKRIRYWDLDTNNDRDHNNAQHGPQGHEDSSDQVDRQGPSKKARMGQDQADLDRSNNERMIESSTTPDDIILEDGPLESGSGTMDLVRDTGPGTEDTEGHLEIATTVATGVEVPERKESQHEGGNDGGPEPVVVAAEGQLDTLAAKEEVPGTEEKELERGGDAGPALNSHKAEDHLGQDTKDQENPRTRTHSQQPRSELGESGSGSNSDVIRVEAKDVAKPQVQVPEDHVFASTDIRLKKKPKVDRGSSSSRGATAGRRGRGPRDRGRGGCHDGSQAVTGGPRGRPRGRGQERSHWEPGSGATRVHIESLKRYAGGSWE